LNCRSAHKTLIDNEKEVISLKKVILIPLISVYNVKVLAILAFRSEK